MRLGNFDLNLLIALDALLSERSVTRAARRLNLTQSAMSAALKRLRESLSDDILVQDGKRMIPTPVGMALAPEIRETIERLSVLIASSTGFDPATSTRRFRIAASDYIATVLIAPLIGRLGEIAPGVTLDLSLPQKASLILLAQGELDLFLTPEQFTSADHPRELLFEERHVVVGCARNPAMRAMTQTEFSRCGHVAVYIENRPTFAEEAIRNSGIVRRVEITVPSFIQVPWLLPGTNRIALMHERLALLIAKDLHLAVAPVPVELKPMREMMQYHSTREKDAGLLWLRRELHALAKERAR